MTNIKYYLVSVDRCEPRKVELLSQEEKKSVICYAVNPKYPKDKITDEIKTVNEWELEWHDNRYQTLQYYEYGFFAHALKNPWLINGLTHVGLLHYDVRFHEDSVNYHHEYLDLHPETIFYNTKRKTDQLYFSTEQVMMIGKWMAQRISGFKPNYQNILWDGWYSEALSITPRHIFVEFGNFFITYQYEIEELLNNNTWGLMNNVKHRLCGFTERLWGMYLASLDMPKKVMMIDHEHTYYDHIHLNDKKNFLNKF